MSMDMTLLPAPQVIEALSFEAIYQERLAKFQELYPDFALVLESDPAVKLLEVMAWQELLMRQRINDAAKACMLAYAVGTDLDALAANFQVQRLIITPGDPDANPPVEEVAESDDRLRERVQSALEGITTAGPRESYRFHALTASALVADVGIDSPDPGSGKVRVTVLSIDPSGVPSEPLLDTVRAALNAEHIRPLCDLVIVQGPEIIESPIVATLYRKAGAAGDVAAAQARAALDTWLLSVRRLGAGLPRSGIDAALHQPGMSRVDLVTPAADLLCTPTQWVRITGIDLTEVIVDE